MNTIDNNKQVPLESLINFIEKNSTDVFWVLDGGFKQVYISPVYFQMRGITEEESKKEKLEDKYTPESIEIIKSILLNEQEKFSNTSGIANGNIDVEIYCYHEDKSRYIKPVNISWCAGIENGSIKYMCGITRDIKKRLDIEKMNAIIEMAGGICHSINQPLQGVTGYIELLKMELDEIDLPEDNMIQHKIDKAMGCVNKINELIKNVRYMTSENVSLENIKMMNYSGGTQIINIEDVSIIVESLNP